ncbi:VanZ family protein [Rossellomorea vietnamensis]|uniref:VanZ family protein n=1 Tax=Rossellomorea vietnamensis TaxID=218284 RepID=UPI0016538BEC|nr:VanZ family protein [Rossellomorea vietnamensis]
MRLLVVFLYLGLLFVLTCSYSFREVMVSQRVSFIFNSQPDLLSFFEYKFNYNNPSYAFQKAGHVISFFVLAALLMIWRNKVAVVLLVSILFAVFTEVAQLFFHRTGCLVDVLFDLTGTAAFLLIYSWSRVGQKEVESSID